MSPISDDWFVDFVSKTISHIDGELDYDGNTGDAPGAGDYIRGASGGAVGKILTGTDLDGTNATGTFTLTNVDGRFQDNEALTTLDTLPFGEVTGGGFEEGDTLDEAGAGTGSIIVRAIEYNGVTGTIYGDHSGDDFTAGDGLEKDGTQVAEALDIETSGASFTDALVNEPTNETITQPTISSIINYTGG